MSKKCCLILHRKSANREDVRVAVKAARKSGIRLRVRIPWIKKDKSKVVREAIGAGEIRIIAGGGEVRSTRSPVHLYGAFKRNKIKFRGRTTP